MKHWGPVKLLQDQAPGSEHAGSLRLKFRGEIQSMNISFSITGKWLIYFHNGIKLLFIVLLHSIKKSTEVCSSPSSSCLHVNNMQTTCNMQTVHVHNLGFILAVYTRFILVSDGPGLNPKHSMIFIMLLIMFDWETWEWCQNITNGVISN